MQTQELNEKQVLGGTNANELWKLQAESDANLVAAFYHELIKLGLSIEVAKDLTIGYIVRHTIFGQ